MEYRIEKGIVPPSQKYGTRNGYPFEDMEVGDSFTFPEAHETKLRSAVQNYKKAHPETNFTVRRGLLRCWRTA